MRATVRWRPVPEKTVRLSLAERIRALAPEAEDPEDQERILELAAALERRQRPTKKRKKKRKVKNSQPVNQLVRDQFRDMYDG